MVVVVDERRLVPERRTRFYTRRCGRSVDTTRLNASIKRSDKIERLRLTEVVFRHPKCGRCIRRMLKLVVEPRRFYKLRFSTTAHPKVMKRIRTTLLK